MTTKHETIPCAFCHGKGTDPFNQLSELSRCEACDGTGVVSVPGAARALYLLLRQRQFQGFCCQVCGGKGAAPVPEGTTCVCPVCGGTAFESSSGLTCLNCQGLGQVAFGHRRRSGH